MDSDTKFFLGKILGEIYRLQEKSASRPSDARLYGLLNGIESAIDEELSYLSRIPTKSVDTIVEILMEFDINKDKLDNLKGYYDLEAEFYKAGIDRATAITVLTYLNAKGSFHEIIKKLPGEHAPMEARFELSPDDTY